MASVVVVKETEFVNKVVGSGVLVVIERNIVRNGVDLRGRCNDGDVGVGSLDGVGEHRKTVCRVTGIATSKVVFVTDLFQSSATVNSKARIEMKKTHLDVVNLEWLRVS